MTYNVDVNFMSIFLYFMLLVGNHTVYMQLKSRKHYCEEKLFSCNYCIVLLCNVYSVACAGELCFSKCNEAFSVQLAVQVE